MTSRLPKRSRAVIRTAMLGRLLSLVMTIALLVGGTLAPAVAHAREGAMEHAMEMLHLDDAVTADDAQQGEDSGKADQAGAHHHCTIAVEVETPAVTVDSLFGRDQFTLGLTPILGSFAQAPPTEPPAA